MSQHNINDNQLLIDGVSCRKPIVHREGQTQYHSIWPWVKVRSKFEFQIGHSLKLKLWELIKIWREVLCIFPKSFGEATKIGSWFFWNKPKIKIVYDYLRLSHIYQDTKGVKFPITKINYQLSISSAISLYFDILRITIFLRKWPR